MVYNAGNGVFGPYTSITMEKLDMAMRTNVHGLLAVAQHVGPKMEKSGEGVIVVTGATASLRGDVSIKLVPGNNSLSLRKIQLQGSP